MHPHIGNQDWVTSYGLVLVIALAACWWLTRRNALAAGFDPSHIDLVFPLSIAGGLATGALLGLGIKLIPLTATGFIVLLVYSRLAGQSFRALVDAFAMPVIVAIAIQRIGCFLAGCCWGEVVMHDGAWAWAAVQFPAGSFAWEQHLAAGLITADAAVSLPVHPTQLYETGLLIPLAVLLHRMGLHRYPAGSIALLAVASYALVRFGIEFLRADSLPIVGELSLNQLLCLLLLLAAMMTAVRLLGNSSWNPAER